MMRFDAHRAQRARALRQLEQALRRQAGTAGVMGTREADGADVLVRPGSLARATLLLEFARPFESAEASLGLTPLAWEGVDSFEPWLELSRPLLGLPRLGTPNPRRPWVLTHTPRALDAALAEAKQLDAQVHVLGGNPLALARARDVVYWPALPAVVLALLGRVERVVGATVLDPLVLDARRAGVPTNFDATSVDASAGTVSPSLFDDERFWRHVAASLAKVRDGEPPAPLFTRHWLREGRRATRTAPATTRSGSSWELVLRRYAKFRREPERYFADSRHGFARAFGKWWFGPE